MGGGKKMFLCLKEKEKETIFIRVENDLPRDPFVVLLDNEICLVDIDRHCSLTLC